MTSTHTAGDVPIAIVGLACRFPGDASSPSKFWDMLKNGKDAYSPTSPRWNSDAFYHPGDTRLNALPTKGGHFLKEDPYVFDAAFFNITATEAIALDPKQRIAMEVTYEAFENAGMSLQRISGTQTACYIGSGPSDYRGAVERDFLHNPKYHLLGTGDEMISNRISHFFNVHGPSATVQTACSSSLMATHLACQSLKSGESEMAITGGVSLMLTPDFTTHLNNLNFLNPEGLSKAFDESAGGYGRGEGCGIIILKRLADAIHDGDDIRAVIRATGANSDGFTQGVTMPSLEAQTALIEHVYLSNGLDYSTQYVEAHGTGTKAGDPIETKAIYSTIGKGSPKPRKLLIGSVKPNIGHLESAAAQSYPPNLHFSKGNPAIPFDEWNIAVPTKLTPWPVAHTKRMSVSGFGMVLESFDPTRFANGSGTINGFSKLERTRAKKRLFVFSSHDQAGFKRNADALVEHLDTVGPVASSSDFMANLSYTLSRARSSLSWRATCIAENMTELRDHLSTDPGEGASRDASSATRAPRIGFVFTGQGAQWARMGVEMLDRPVFRDSVAQSANFLREIGCAWDPVAELKKTQADSRLSQPEISQPICSVLQIALVDELRSWGVTPSRVVGHSSGEIAAAYSIGALSHRDAVAAAYFRGVAATRLRTDAPNLKGGMMAVGCSRDEAEKLIQQSKLDGTAAVACVNSPSSVTLSGDVDALEQLRAILDERKVFARRLKVEMAYHSRHMNRVFGSYAELIADLKPIPRKYNENENEDGRIPTMVSSVTGQEVAPELLRPYYWVRNLVSPVLFSDAVKEMVSPAEDEKEDDNDDSSGNHSDNTVDLLIEVGPHSALGGPVEQILGHHGIKDVAYKSMLTRGRNTLETSLELASELFLRGVPIDISKVNGDLNPRRLTDLPPYQWNHSKVFRHETRIQRELVMRQFPSKSIIGAQVPMMDESQHVWRNFLRLSDEPWLRGHKVGSTVLFPAAGLISMALEAAQQLVEPSKTVRTLRLREISFSAAMALSEDAPTEIILHMRPHLLATSGSTPASWWEFTISSCAGIDHLRDNCRGLITIDYTESTSEQMASEDASLEASRVADYHRVHEGCPDTYSKEDFYGQFEKIAWKYGGAFQGVENVHLGDGRSTYDVRLVDIGETFSKGQLDRPFLIHAGALDSILQGCLGSTYKNGGFEMNKPVLPTFIGQMEISLDIPGDVGYVLPVLCESKRHGFKELSSNIYAFDSAVSKINLSVIDYRVSELENDAGEQDSQQLEVDPAEITSEVLEPEEIKKVVSAVAAEDRLIRLYLHDNPAATVIELAPDYKALNHATMSLLPRGTILPSHIQYAVAGIGNESEDQCTTANVIGKAFDLGDEDDPLPADIAAADLLVAPQSVSNHKDLGVLLGRLTSLGKPDASLVLAVDSNLGNLPPFWRLTDFDASLIRQSEHANGLTNGYTNGNTNGTSSKSDLVIIEPPATNSGISFCSALQATLRDHGYSVVVTNWAEISARAATDLEGKTFISLLELEQPLLDNLSEPDFHNVRKLLLNSDRLLWITAGDNPSMGVVDGIRRTMRSEVAGLKFQVLHLSSLETALQCGPALAGRIVTTHTKDDEFQERDGMLQVARIFISPEGNEGVRHCLEDSVRVQRLADQERPLRLTILKPGLMDTLTFIEDDRMKVPLGESEIEVDVKATGVNFKDIMAAMGLVEVSLIGQEASGVVTATGSAAASRFQPGDRVTLLWEGMHATKLRIDHRLAVHIPGSMSFEVAAALPMVHATAYHALVNVAKLRPGQSVLIHAAAGGVGQAALQLAAHLGLVVYVTVGSEDKRRLLMEKYNVPETHIFHSRDASFAKAIKRVTGGRGVDCVLNSLSGELLRVSWTCLAPFGTFVEIGLRDITNNMRLDMRPFSGSTTFAFINIANFFNAEGLEVLGQILSDAFDLVHKGVLGAAYPLTVYPVAQLETAFRTMQQGKHRGKLVLSFTDNAEAPVLCKAQNSLRLSPDSTYLFVGGLGGLGRSLAREFVACGARHIAFISRSGDSSAEAKATIQDLTTSGAVVKAYRADVADETAFLSAMQQCTTDLPPIAGVLQMAMLLRDTLFEKMSYANWTQPMRPKIQGSLNLHNYFSSTRPLDFFLICSSISGIFGYHGQTQYAAANTFQDALAHYRRSQGLKAVAVDLGIMRDVGILAEQGTTGKLADWEAVLGIREKPFHALMKSLINREWKGVSDASPAQVCTGLGTADVMARFGLERPEHFSDPRFGPLNVLSIASSSSFADQDTSSAASSPSTRLAAASTLAEAVSIITDALVHKTAEILQMPLSEVDPGRPMYRYGVDSLVALEVRNWITRELQANMALLEILAAEPMSAFAGKIAEKSRLVVGRV
ncbi:type I polyketide synthase [Aspergillus novofumigatus IBT 16806]|uniref:Phenolpthiocerol synthesis polyketide synthase ppsB n=1 Tax=Aspergillus novofumigatus (strain IBT 16806) TaxID=1392255 RepID=A0A2I1BV40_ASPN1|nr:phenolpthiocerol synthesis polyketide synthase ppsB [Aspergillus novofumigatus IBT 16806]PKX89224.1 phenolpthiocerol synthesis polyketide synthase ppsB [Aspergillus novofumigatus IBT 16806]